MTKAAKNPTRNLLRFSLLIAAAVLLASSLSVAGTYRAHFDGAIVVGDQLFSGGALEVKMMRPGLVAVRMTAKMDVKGVKIDPSLMKAEEREVLEDLLVTAFGDARRKAETAMQEKMQALTGGLGLPPGLFGQ